KLVAVGPCQVDAFFPPENEGQGDEEIVQILIVGWRRVLFCQVENLDQELPGLVGVFDDGFEPFPVELIPGMGGDKLSEASHLPGEICHIMVGATLGDVQDEERLAEVPCKVLDHSKPAAAWVRCAHKELRPGHESLD